MSLLELAKVVDCVESDFVRVRKHKFKWIEDEVIFLLEMSKYTPRLINV